MLNVAYHTEIPGWNSDGMFDLTSPANTNDVLVRWAALQEYARQRDVALHTHDMFGSTAEVDLWLIDNPLRSKLRFLLRNRINPKDVILFLIEPDVFDPWTWKHLRWWKRLFGGILTWHTELAEVSDRIYHYHFPTPFHRSRYEEFRASEKKNLCMLMRSNKTSKVKGELYSYRRNLIEYFDARGDHLMDLYGKRWNVDRGRRSLYTDLYKGLSDDKHKTFSEYSFVFCVENSNGPGYIEYDQFIAMATGVVPLYKPAQDADSFIPSDTYINLDRYQNLDELVDHMKGLVGTREYAACVDRGWDFLNSAKYTPFTVESFCQRVFHAIEATAKARGKELS